jgi:hypothetical protein
VLIDAVAINRLIRSDLLVIRVQGVVMIAAVPCQHR